MLITFAEEFDVEAQARISAVLHRVRTAGGVPGFSSWSPDRIAVERQFGDGLSGALVIGLRVTTDGMQTRHVAKLAPAEEVHSELRAFREIFHQLPNTLFVPIRTATPGADDPATAREFEPDEAVVSVDVVTWAGSEHDQEVVSLERLVERAMAPEAAPDEVERARASLDRLLSVASQAMYRGARPLRDQDVRMKAKTSFGPDLHVVVDGVDPKGQPVYGKPDRQTLDAHVRAPLDLVRTGLAAPGEERNVSPGELITLTVDGTRTTGEGFLVHRDDATVAVEFEPGGDTATLRSLDPDEVRYIHGKVTDTRPHRVRRRIAAALGPSGDTPGVVRVDGTCARDPFALLDHVVRERTAATLVGVVHGDLNHRNVLFCDNRPFLIDYARGRRNMPVLDDLAWLEMNMLRRPLADGLSFGDLVAVQRLLLLGDLVADVLPSGPDGIGALGERLAGLVAHRGRGAVTAIRLLATLRARVRQICAGKDTGRPWWSEYQVALLLAAHRTFKWPDDLQTVAGWRAQVASGCVATEALEAGGPGLGLWDGAELAAAARALLPLLPDEPDPRAAGLLAAVVEGLSAERESDTGLADVLRRARTAVARAVAGPAAHRRRRELDEERGTRTPFIDLSAEVAVSAARGVRRTWSEAAGAVDRVLAEPDALVLGGSGSGRTTLLDEVERRRLAALLETGPASTEGAETAVPGLLPLRLAEDVVGLCGDGQMLEQQVIAALETVAPGADGRQLLAGGAVHLLADLPGGAGAEAMADALRQFRCRRPAVPVTAATPGREPSAAHDGCTAVRLLGPRPEQAARYLARRSAQRGLGPEHAAELIDLVLSGTWAELLREGRCSPLLLSRLARWPVGAPARHRPVNEYEVLDAYFTETRTTWPYAIRRHVKARAAHLTDPQEEPRGNEKLSEEQQALLIDSGVLTPEGAFHRVEERDYFAYRWLRSRTQDRALLLRLAPRHRWYGAFRLLSALAPSSQKWLPRLVEELAGADPVQTARLLGAPAHPSRRLVEPFLHRQAAALADRQAGELEHIAAADSLAAFDAPVAYSHLLTALSDADGPETARTAALRALVTAARTTHHAAQSRRLAGELAHRLAPLITPDGPRQLTLSALDAVGTLGLNRLVLHTADLVRPGAPWPLVRAALAALDALDTSRTAALSEIRLSVEREGLSHVERAMDAPLSSREAGALAAEREQLIQRLPGPERICALLERRFAPGFGELAGELLEEHVHGAPLPDGATPAEVTLWRRGEPETAYAALRTATDALCLAAAVHRLLYDAPARAADPFVLLSGPESPAGPGSPERAGPVAATVRWLPTELLAQAEQFALTAAEACVPASSLDGIAALVDALFARDRPAGARLARRIHRIFTAAGLPARLQGAWNATLTRCSAYLASASVLLPSSGPDRGDDSQDAVLEALADHGFLLLAAPVPDFQAHGAGSRFPDDVLRRLRSSGPDALPRLARAAVVLGLVDALPVLCEAITQRDGAGTGVPVSLGAFGVREVSPFAELLVATGYLAALAGAGSVDAVRAYQAVSELDTSGAHPSVRVARLTALAVSGNWAPVLDALPDEDPRLPLIARNALVHWLPGPFTPADADASAAARQLTARLAEGHGLTPEARSQMYGLRTALERHTGTATIHRPPHT
ncbi:hypothetical protein [Streptomyces cyaneofuscatus]|uniref:Ternary complex associated domain-containing protein n=1 Tax=Streptomyces cyaneofuscatus TaxID=66883 RepID=A0ABZ1F663_9ACTN|nr:hypothetical protein [Streptomyces cyaneofuscatus]WSB11614.1 hypothetical protein OG849_32305 [Streptomyces cyaneofuscatus]WSD44852.1 hypothetical protein OG857_03095 [Streptomyces cyaneofuscatus]